MKHTSRIQPFVAVTQKEADAIEMDNRITDIVSSKTLNPSVKSRLLEDGMARLTNFKDDKDVTVVEEPPAKVPKVKKNQEQQKKKTVEDTPKKKSFSKSKTRARSRPTASKSTGVKLKVHSHKSKKVPNYMKGTLVRPSQVGKGMYIKKWK